MPLIARHLLRKAAAQSPEVAQRFLDPAGEPRVDPALVEALLRRPYPANVRELETVLWAAMRGSPGDRVILTEELREEGAAPPAGEAASPGSSRAPASHRAEGAGREPTPDEIREALRRHDDNLTKAARALGLPSRFVLYRLIKTLGIELSALRGGEDEGGERRG